MHMKTSKKTLQVTKLYHMSENFIHHKKIAKLLHSCLWPVKFSLGDIDLDTISWFLKADTFYMSMVWKVNLNDILGPKKIIISHSHSYIWFRKTFLNTFILLSIWISPFSPNSINFHFICLWNIHFMGQPLYNFPILHFHTMNKKQDPRFAI